MPLHSHLKADAERAIVAATVDVLLNAGFKLTVHNGGDEPELESSTDKDRILGVMFATADETLYAGKAGHHGWVYFVYGNGGWDVMSDYTVNLEEVLKPVNDGYADAWEACLEQEKPAPAPFALPVARTAYSSMNAEQALRAIIDAASTEEATAHFRAMSPEVQAQLRRVVHAVQGERA